MATTKTAPLVGIVMGSKTDADVMNAAREILDELGVPCEMRVISAHRSPERALEYAATAETRGLEVLIAGAGVAAALPGVVAAKTLLPVIGVPVPAGHLAGIDALLAICQMPKGVPVATMAIGKAGAANAGLLAAQILAAKRPELREKLRAWREKRNAEALAGEELA